MRVLKHRLQEGFEASSFPAPSGQDGRNDLRRKKEVNSDRILCKLKASDLKLRLQDTKVSAQERDHSNNPHRHSLESVYSSTSKETKEGSGITIEGWTYFLVVLSELIR
jgi:hypothetical protein